MRRHHEVRGAVAPGRLDLVQQRLQRFFGGPGYFDKHRLAVSAPEIASKRGHRDWFRGGPDDRRNCMETALSRSTAWVGDERPRAGLAPTVTSPRTVYRPTA